MVESGIILIKYWLEVSEEEQTRRLESRIDDGRKIWKLSPMDLKSYSRWYDYSRARDDMFVATDTGFAPWYVAKTDDKKRARLNIITHLLEQDSVRGIAAREDRIAEAAEGRRLRRPRVFVQVHQRSVLTRTGRASRGEVTEQLTALPNNSANRVSSRMTVGCIGTPTGWWFIPIRSCVATARAFCRSVDRRT